MAIDLKKTFEKYDGTDTDGTGELLEFSRIENPLSKRPDLCAFLLLDKLVPGNRDIVGDAGHDEIGLDVDLEALAEAATEEDIITLIRCGVRYDEEDNWLQMFV
jgi:hypothetical protein